MIRIHLNFMKHISILLISLSILSNCNGVKTSVGNDKIPQIVSKVNRTYLVQSLYKEDVSDHKITMVFDYADLKLSGFSGCNMYYCNYTISDSSMSVGMPGASKRYCEKAMKLEKQFFKGLSEIAYQTKTNNSITFKNNKGIDIIFAKKR